MEQYTPKKNIMKKSNNYKRFKDYSDKEQTILLLKGYEVSIEGGSEFWLLNNGYHREDGPAVVLHTGTRAWYLNDKRHREDGPAIIWDNGDIEYWVWGQRIMAEDYLLHFKDIDILTGFQ